MTEWLTNNRRSFIHQSLVDVLSEAEGGLAEIMHAGIQLDDPIFKIKPCDTFNLGCSSAASGRQFREYTLDILGDEMRVSRR